MGTQKWGTHFKRNPLTQRNSLPSTQNEGGYGAYVRGTHIVEQFFHHSCGL